MELIHEIFYAVVCAEIFLCVQAQVIFIPDQEEDLKLQLGLLTPPVNLTTVNCFSSAPKFKVQYVTPENQEAVFDIDVVNGKTETDGFPIPGSTCNDTSKSQYGVILKTLKFLTEPALVGGTFQLKATLNNDAETSSFSKRTYSFPAPFNLTGSSSSASLNSSFNWTCHVTSENSVIEWFRGSTSLGQVGFVECKPFGKNNSYIFTCQQSALKYTLTIPGSGLTEELQASSWRCKDPASDLKGSWFMKLNIVVPVRNVTISPGSGSTLDAVEYQTITLTCVTNNANPSPTILWFIGSSDVTSQAGSNRTTLTVNVTRMYQGIQVRCDAWNEGNTANETDSTTLNVRFPPADNEHLQIVGYINDTVLYENNQTMSISCIQPGGNPLANMTFTCASKTGTNENTDKVAIRQLNMTNDRNLNGKRCVCISTHINGFVRSRNTSLNVYYPPSTPTIRPSSSFPWKTPGNNSLSCMATPGNPAYSTFIWYEGGSVLQNSTNEYIMFNPLNSSDNKRILRCQVNNNFTLHENVVLTSENTTLQVEYNPVVTLEQNSVEVIEGHSVELQCTATGNPTPNVTWSRDSKPVTGISISSSNLSIVNVNRTATGNYTCQAQSSSASNILRPDQKTLFLRVFYAPTVSLYLQSATENTTSLPIICTAMGDPNNATIVAIKQTIGSTLIRNITNLKETSPGNITLNIPVVSYQDMGNYTCLASNGIPDRSNQTIQSDTAYLNVNTSAKFEMMQYIVRSDIDTPAAAEIPFYINPPANESDVVWTSNTRSSNETLVSSANVSLFLRDTDVQQTLHGVDVALRGQSAIMNITSFQSFYERNYTLQIRSSYTDSAEVTVIFIRSGPPDTPLNFQLLTRKVTAVVLTWNKGSDGGHQQTFVLLYKEKKAEVYNAKQIVDTTVNVTITDEMKHLKSDTSYEFILYSFNKKGNSSHHKILEERTLKEPSTSTPSSLNSGLVGGAAGGGAALLVIIVVLVVVLKWKRNKREDNDSKGILNDKEMSAGPSKQSDDDEDEGGLKDNPLYGSSPSGANAVQGASAAPENLSQYADVVKPMNKSPANESQDPPPIYAEVDKSKKKGKGLMKLKKQSPPRVGEDPPPIYAEVHKSNKKNGKGKQQKQKTNKGDVYEVVGGFKEKETQFNDPAGAQKNKEGGQRGYRNQDGLLYVDIKFDQPPPTGKPIIRGEERTGYAMIEFEEPPTYSTADDVKGAEGGE